MRWKKPVRLLEQRIEPPRWKFMNTNAREILLRPGGAGGHAAAGVFFEVASSWTMPAIDAGSSYAPQVFAARRRRRAWRMPRYCLKWSADTARPRFVIPCGRAAALDIQGNRVFRGDPPAGPRSSKATSALS